jgi:outer membrane protein assembly factor BamB
VNGVQRGFSGLFAIAGLGAIAFASGCGTAETANDRVNAETPPWFHRPSGAMHVVVDRALTAPSRSVGEDYERGRAEIDPPHGRVFVGSSDHGLYALRAGDGSSIWRYETAGVVQSEPLYDAEMDTVYFGSHDGALYAVRAADGALVWRYSSGAEIARKPVLSGETLFFANGADQLFAIDRRTGKTKWSVHRTPALGMEVAGYAGPTFANGLVYAAYSDGHVIAYDANDGTERWTPVDLSAEAEQTAGDAPRYLDVDTTPVADDLPNGKVVYVASYAGGVFALDAVSGARVWMNEKAIGVTDLLLWREPAHRPNANGPDRGGPMVPERRVLIASSAVSGLWAIEPLSGRMLWRVPVPEGGITAPVPVMGALLYGTTRYGAFLVSPINGKVIDGFDLGSGFAQTPAAYGNRAYVLSNAGTFVGVQIEDPIGRPRSRDACPW